MRHLSYIPSPLDLLTEDEAEEEQNEIFGQMRALFQQLTGMRKRLIGKVQKLADDILKDHRCNFPITQNGLAVLQNAARVYLEAQLELVSKTSKQVAAEGFWTDILKIYLLPIMRVAMNVMEHNYRLVLTASVAFYALGEYDMATAVRWGPLGFGDDEDKRASSEDSESEESDPEFDWEEEATEDESDTEELLMMAGRMA